MTRALSGAFVLLVCSVAHADPTTGIAADRLRFGIGPATLAGAEGAETTPSGNVSTLLALDYLRDPIVLRTASDNVRLSEPVKQQLVGHFGFEIGLPRRFAIQVSLPVAMWNDGDRLRGSGATGDAATQNLHAAAGDLMLGVKVALLGHADAPGLHVAFALDGTAPMGGNRQFAAASWLTIAPRLHLDYRLPWLSIVLDAQVRFESSRSLFDTRLGDELDLTGGVIGRLWRRRNVQLSAYVECAGVVESDPHARAVEMRGALRLARAGLHVDVGAGGALDDAVAAPRYRIFAALRVPLAR